MLGDLYMASGKEYLDFILEQLSELNDMTYQAMMGEYIIYYRGKIVGGSYNDRFLVKPTKSAAAMMPNADMELPYEGAKEVLFVDDVDNKDFLRELLEAMYEELPVAKKKKLRRQIKAPTSAIIGDKERGKEKIGMNVKLVKWTQEIKPELIKICNDVDRSYLSNRLPYPYTEESADRWLDMVSEHDGKDSVFRAIVADGKIVGNISVEQKSDVCCKDGEIGYLLLTDFRSKGIITEAVRQICDVAFTELDIIRITGLVYAPNVASQRVLEKNSFAREGIQKNAVYKNGQIYDLFLYAKLK